MSGLKDRVQKLSRPDGGCEPWQSLLRPDVRKKKNQFESEIKNSRDIPECYLYIANGFSEDTKKWDISLATDGLRIGFTNIWWFRRKEVLNKAIKIYPRTGGRGVGGSNLFPIHLQNPCIKSRSSPETERESSLTPNIAPGTPALNDELADCSGVHPP